MIERNTYFKIVELYNKDKNLNRLVYRIIKFEDTYLSYEQLCNRIIKIIYDQNEINDFNKETERLILESRNKMRLHLESLDCQNIYNRGSEFSYTRGNNSYTTSNLHYENEIEKVRNNLYREKYLDAITKALDTTIEFDYVEEFKDKRYYSTNNKIKSITLRYKAKK